ncbi:MAG: HAD-IIIA family hydrolase [Bacteroidales bacterium]|nr:HAD-IIIA family hydrolase [Bacteroidales bacterium]
MTNYKSLLNNINTFIFDYDGVLTDGKIYLTQDGELQRTVNVRDGYIMQLAAKKGYNIAIITGGKSMSVFHRFHNLGINDVFLGVRDKYQVYKNYISENNINPENVLYMGDDIPDFEVMNNVGMPTCPADAVEEIKSISKYISDINGGDGCVRDIIEQVLKVQGRWMKK